MRKLLLLVVVMSVALACAAQEVPDAPSAQSPAAALPPTSLAAPQATNAKGSWEIGITAGGGHSVAGGTSDTGVFNANVRFGYVLTSEHGPGVLKGTFEYAAEVTPVNVIFQQTNVYGFSFTPVLMKWNFTSGMKVVPYLEVGGGVLLTSSDVPAGTNNVNFTPQAAFGLQFFHRPDRAISAAVRYVHISSAGLAAPNPGINTVQFTLGYHWWKRH
jgi:lipid A 3-O-deacylase